MSEMDGGAGVNTLAWVPDGCLPIRIAAATGMLLAVVLEVIGGLLG